MLSSHRGAKLALYALILQLLTCASPLSADPTPSASEAGHQVALEPTMPASSQTSTTPLPEVDPPTAELNCGPTPVKVGLPTLCTLKIIHSPQISIKVTLPSGVEEGAVTPPIQLPNGQWQALRVFTLRHLELDKPLRIKGVSVTWDHTQGQSGILTLPAQKLEVQPSISSVLEPKVRTFKAPLPKAAKTKEEQAHAEAVFWAQHGPPPLIELNWLLIFILAGLCISAFGIGLGWLIRRWVEAIRRARMPVIDTRPAHIIALEAYELLVARRLPEEGQTKQYYHELSEIIRTYLGRRFGLSGLEMTSDEVRSAADQAQVTEEQELLIDQFLTDSDLVKFADMNPSQKAVDDISELALQVIDATKAHVVPQTELQQEQSSTTNPTSQPEHRSHEESQASQSATKEEM